MPHSTTTPTHAPVRAASAGSHLATLDSRTPLASLDVIYDELDAPAQYVRKTVTIDPAEPPEFCDQAAVHARLSKAGAPHWARLAEGLQEGTVVQLVTTYHPATVQRLVNEQARLTPRQLHAIIAGTVAGLVEIQHLLGRPHGNLKATNVLLRSRHLTPAAVALTDPAPSAVAMQHGTAGDLRQLGQILHLLMLHRLSRGGAGDWPVPPSPEWRRLGRVGDRWRELCTLLTDPAGPVLTLDDVAAMVARLRPTRGARAARMVGSAAAVMVIGLVLAHHLTRPTNVAVAPPSPAPKGHVAVARPAVAPTPVALQDTARPARFEPPKPPSPEPSIAPHVTVPPPPPPALPTIDPQVAQRLVTQRFATANQWASSLLNDVRAWNEHRLDDANRRRVARFVDDCTRPLVTAIPDFAREAELQNQRFANEARGLKGDLPNELVARRDRVVSRLLLADRSLNARAGGELSPTKPVTPTGAAVSAALHEWFDRARAAAITGAIEATRDGNLTDPQFAARLELLGTAVVDARTAATKLATDADQVARWLDLGFTPDAAPQGNRPIRDLLAAWSAGPLASDPAVKAALAPLVSTIADVDAADPKRLRDIAAAPDQPLGLRVTAWRQGEALPATRATITADVAVRDALRKAADAHQGSAAYAAAVATIDHGFARRWQRFLATAASSADVAYAMSPAVRPPLAKTADLTGAARWNAKLYELRAALASNAGFAKAREVAADLAASFDGPTHTDPAPSPAVAALLVKLRDWQGSGTSAAPDFSQSGPASASARSLIGSGLRWTAEPDATGATVTYVASTADAQSLPEATLVFRRVSGANGVDAYVCTTETSVGLFGDVISAANRWREVKDARLLPGASLAGADAWAGPRAWHWSPRRDGGITRSLVWLSSDWVPDGADHYPESIGGEFNRTTLRPPPNQPATVVNPSRRSPMQQLSADAAQYFATLTGCRLPTPQEWTAAYAASKKAVGANLRDKSWRLENEHMARTWPRSRSGGGAYRADAGMFVPAGESPTDDVWHAAGGEEYDDGVLWFRETLADGADAHEFQNLAGNVGEIVRDADAAAGAKASSAAKVYVIGGSALSPPTRPLDKPFELNPRDVAQGFTDVGFRLAFPAPPTALDRLAAIVAGDDGYALTPSK